jgi:hypothetical protein
VPRVPCLGRCGIPTPYAPARTSRRDNPRGRIGPGYRNLHAQANGYSNDVAKAGVSYADRTETTKALGYFDEIELDQTQRGPATYNFYSTLADARTTAQNTADPPATSAWDAATQKAASDRAARIGDAQIALARDLGP